MATKRARLARESRVLGTFAKASGTRWRLTGMTAGSARKPISPRSVNALAVSPDGAFVVAARTEGLEILDVATLDPTEAPSGRCPQARSVRFSEDGRELFVRTQTGAGIWRMDGLKPRFELAKWTSRDTACFAPAAEIVVHDQEQRASRWNVRQKKRAGAFEVFTEEDKESPDDEFPHVWTLLDVDPRGEVGVWWRGYGEDPVRLHAWLVALETGTGPRGRLELEGHVVCSGAIAPSGRWAALGGEHCTACTVDLETARSGREVAAIDDTGGRWPVWATAISPDNRTWATTCQRDIRIWELGSENPLDRLDMNAFDDAAHALAFSPDGRALFAGTARGRVLRFEPVSAG